jgi:hypothetical protein
VGRRRTAREPEVKVAVRAAAQPLGWLDAAMVAAIAALATAMSALWWLGASGHSP